MSGMLLNFPQDTGYSSPNNDFCSERPIDIIIGRDAFNPLSWSKCFSLASIYLCSISLLLHNGPWNVTIRDEVGCDGLKTEAACWPLAQLGPPSSGSVIHQKASDSLGPSLLQPLHHHHALSCEYYHSLVSTKIGSRASLDIDIQVSF